MVGWHLAQFRCLIDPVHVTARAVRARKDDTCGYGNSGDLDGATYFEPAEPSNASINTRAYEVVLRDLLGGKSRSLASVSHWCVRVPVGRFLSRA